MVQGAQTNATGFVALCLESTSGTPEAAPQTDPNGYVVLSGDMAPVSKKAPKFNEVSGQIFPTLPVPGGESFEMSLPMYPVMSGNGLGPMLAALLGDDTLSTLVALHAFGHEITWEDLIKTYTLFCHYGTLDDDQYRMCAMDSLSLKSKSSDNSLVFDFKAMGTALEKLSTGAVLTNLFIDPDSASQLTHAGMLAEIGQPGAAVRDLIEDLSIDLKRNLVFGCLQKPGQHPAGSASHNIVNSKKSNCELKFTAIDTDREEILRSMYPVNTDPSAQVRYTDTMRYIKARFSWYGASLYAGINGEADYCNAGTSAVAWAGTYSGGDTVTVGELEMSDSDIYETALGSNKDLAFRLLDTGATYEVVTGAGALTCEVAVKAITVTLAAAGSTASAILAKILATPAAVALLTPSLADGSTGAGTVTEAQASISTTNFKDGFRYRYTTGGAWSSWTAWIKVTKAAQTIVSGITATFDDDDIGSDNDRFRFCSHYREMFRITIPNLAYKDIPKTTFKDGLRKIEVELIHTSATEAERPVVTVWNSEGTAFDAAS